MVNIGVIGYGYWGPNIKVELNEIQSYIEANSNILDYYIMFEGEEPFGGIVENVLSRKKLANYTSSG